MKINTLLKKATSFFVKVESVEEESTKIHDNIRKIRERYDTTNELWERLMNHDVFHRLEQEIEEYKSTFEGLSLRERQVRYHRIMERIQIQIDGFACVAVSLQHSFSSKEQYEKAKTQFEHLYQLKDTIMNYKAC